MLTATLPVITHNGLPPEQGGVVVGFEAHGDYGTLLPVPAVGSGQTPDSLRQILEQRQTDLRRN